MISILATISLGAIFFAGLFAMWIICWEIFNLKLNAFLLIIVWAIAGLLFCYVIGIIILEVSGLHI